MRRWVLNPLRVLSCMEHLELVSDHVIWVGVTFPVTGKTLLAKAVANQTSATFLRVCGSELIQKYLVSHNDVCCHFIGYIRERDLNLSESYSVLPRITPPPLCSLMKLMLLEQKGVTYIRVTNGPY